MYSKFSYISDLIVYTNYVFVYDLRNKKCEINFTYTIMNLNLQNNNILIFR